MKVQCTGWDDLQSRICPNEATTEIDNVPYCPLHALEDRLSSIAYRVHTLERQMQSVIRAAASNAEAAERPRTASALRDLL